MKADGQIGMNRRDALKVTGAGLTIPLVSSAAWARSPDGNKDSHFSKPGRGQSFDLDWHFFRGETDGLTAADEGWRKVDLPHDWSIEDIPQQEADQPLGPFTQKAIGGVSTGYAVGGEGWYRKHFSVVNLPENLRIEVHFEGVSVASEIWLNGHQIGSQTHPYAPFTLDLTPHLNRSGENILALRVRNLGRNSRWYAGSGIYRPVTIDIVPQNARISRCGVAAWTRRIAGVVAEIEVTTAIASAPAKALLRTSLIDKSGKVAATVTTSAAEATVQVLKIHGPKLWSPGSPHRYRLESQLIVDGQPLDRMEQDFGIRIVTFSTRNGMQINGDRITLRGGCIHHDNGLLGACAYADADDRRIRLLKSRGFNAIRSSHNPASSSLRSACDRHGMLLIEEAFDAWHLGKLPDDYAQHFAGHWREALSAMVLAARNSPSVIMWSIGNEIPDRSTPQGVEWSWKLANEVKRLDPTRPVTAGLNQWLGHPMVAEDGTARAGHASEISNASTLFLDVAGYNYRLAYIEAEHKTYPDRIVYASETFAKDSYDYWELASRAPYMLGEFVWTAMDYLGEAGIGIPSTGIGPSPLWPPTGWPQISAFCGDIDLIGQQKPQSLYRDVVWGISPIEIAVQRPLPEGQSEWMMAWGWSDELQSWTWPGHEGKPMAIRVYTSGDETRLILNGQEVGRTAIVPEHKKRAEFTLPYSPGKLEVVALRNGKELGRKQFRTAAKPSQIRLRADHNKSGHDRQCLSYVTLEVCDAQGYVVPDAAIDVQLSLDGPAELLAFGSASPFASGSFKSGKTTSWHGRALAVLRSQGRAGTVRIEASSAGLTGGVVQIAIE